MVEQKGLRHKLVLIFMAMVLTCGASALLSCGGSSPDESKMPTLTSSPTPSPTPVSTLSPSEQREKVVQFMKEVEDANNKFTKDLSALNPFYTGDLQQWCAGVEAQLVLTEEFQREVEAAIPPPGFPDLAEFKAALLMWIAKVNQLNKDTLLAAQANGGPDHDKLQILSDQWEADPINTRVFQMENAIMAKYNLSKSEIDYRTN